MVHHAGGLMKRLKAWRLSSLQCKLHFSSQPAKDKCRNDGSVVEGPDFTFFPVFTLFFICYLALSSLTLPKLVLDIELKQTFLCLTCLHQLILIFTYIPSPSSKIICDAAGITVALFFTVGGGSIEELNIISWKGWSNISIDGIIDISFVPLCNIQFSYDFWCQMNVWESLAKLICILCRWDGATHMICLTATIINQSQPEGTASIGKTAGWLLCVFWHLCNTLTKQQCLYTIFMYHHAFFWL